jgi:hypothetical protein
MILNLTPTTNSSFNFRFEFTLKFFARSLNLHTYNDHYKRTYFKLFSRLFKRAQIVSVTTNFDFYNWFYKELKRFAFKLNLPGLQGYDTHQLLVTVLAKLHQ